MVKYKVVPLFVTFMVLSGILAMFIDSITVILFLAAVTIELSQLLKFNPVPMILAEVFCANLGGSATMCGDPPMIIIGTSLGYSFTDFLTNTGVIAGVSLVVVVLYFYLVFHKELRASEAAAAGSNQTYPDPSEAITDKKGFIISTIIFLCAVVLLVTHAQTGLTVSCIGVFISIVTLIAAGKDALKLIKQIDYKTLLFLHRTVHGSGRPGADRHPESYGEFHRRHQQRQSDADDRYYPVDLCDCQRLRG